ncbi:uncharacterized protein LOC122008092 isoform X2 [Zingiber officinale]|uniref:uncharacterized protein LOC122008092 isoform X2 n=1 Tax=Zingiber officinale TaxID=94328 RepID=UPI001C4D1087|nr:uncharacterized protein LOC122008092 isoform X2 [Zingiber officinale]
MLLRRQQRRPPPAKAAAPLPKLQWVRRWAPSPEPSVAVMPAATQVEIVAADVAGVAVVAAVIDATYFCSCKIGWTSRHPIIFLESELDLSLPTNLSGDKGKEKL